MEFTKKFKMPRDKLKDPQLEITKKLEFSLEMPKNVLTENQFRFMKKLCKKKFSELTDAFNLLIAENQIDSDDETDSEDEDSSEDEESDDESIEFPESDNKVINDINWILKRHKLPYIRE